MPLHPVVSPRGHVVQFYGGDDELAQSVAGYIGETVAGGGVAVVAATRGHRRAFTTRLTAAGLDVAAARLSGALVMLDADAAARRFTVAGQLDRAAFRAGIGRVVREAVAAGRPVRVFGEMVARLWDAGHVNAALELESAWNDLAREIPFALYCAYPQQLADADGDAFAEVLRLHSAAVRPAGGAAPAEPGEQASRLFPAGRAAPRAARGFVLQTLHGWGRDACAWDAALVVTELATNAVIHAESRFTVSLTGTGAGVRISVGDAAPFAGTGAALQAVPGHGLAVVDAVAAAWDVQPMAGGKAVWAELR